MKSVLGDERTGSSQRGHCGSSKLRVWMRGSSTEQLCTCCLRGRGLCEHLPVISCSPGRVRMERGVRITSQVSYPLVPFICSTAAYKAHWHIDEIRPLVIEHVSQEEPNHRARLHTLRRGSEGTTLPFLTHRRARTAAHRPDLDLTV